MIAATAIATQTALACTSFLLRTTDNSAVYGRTMEFAMPLKSSVLVVPRNYALSSTGADGKPGMSWQGKYSAVGLIEFRQAVT